MVFPHAYFPVDCSFHAAALFCLGEPTPSQFFQGNAGQIRLNIEYGSAIKHVHSTNMQTGSFAAQQFDDGQADRIWAARRTRGKDAVGSVCPSVVFPSGRIRCAVEHPQHIEMRKPFNVGQPLFICRQHFENTLGLMNGAHPFGNLGSLRVRTADRSNWLHRNHDLR